MEEILYRYNPWWESEIEWEEVFERPSVLALLKKHFLSKEILFLTGLRRVGKTTLLKIFIRHLIETEKISPKHIFYISLQYCPIKI